MPWTAKDEFAGFSRVEPWLPIPEEHRSRAVDVQEPVSDSLLSAYRRFLAWRRQHPALRAGSIRFLDAPDSALAFVREHEKERILSAFNLSADPASIPLPSGSTVTPMAGHGFTETISEGQIQLLPYDAFFGTMKP